MHRLKKLNVELTQNEAAVLQQAIDDYFSSHGMTDTDTSEVIEQMHSKLSNALTASGHGGDDFDGLHWLN
jgi:hypothetical protein